MSTDGEDAVSGNLNHGSLNLVQVTEELALRIRKAVEGEVARLTKDRRRTTKAEVRVAAEKIARKFRCETGFNYGADLSRNLMEAASREAAWVSQQYGPVTGSMAFYVAATVRFRMSQ